MLPVQLRLLQDDQTVWNPFDYDRGWTGDHSGHKDENASKDVYSMHSASPPASIYDNTEAIVVVRHFSSMDLADPHFYKAAGIDVVLAADLYQSVLTEELIDRGKGMPVVHHTVLRWILAAVYIEEAHLALTSIMHLT